MKALSLTFSLGLLWYGCVGQPTNTPLYPVLTNTSTPDGDVSVPQIRMDSSPSSPDIQEPDAFMSEPFDPPTGNPDEFTYFGLCQLRVAGARNVLFNDELDPDVLDNILARRPGYGFELDTAGTPGLSSTGIPGEFSYAHVGDYDRVVNFTYAIRTPGGLSQRIGVRLSPPPNVLAVTNFSDAIERNDQCSLRDAISVANGHLNKEACGNVQNGPYHIVMGQLGGVELSRTHAGGIQDDPQFTAEESVLAGDLDVTAEMTIHGCGHADTFIDGGRSRIFQVWADGSLTLERMTLRGGFSPLGGAVLNEGTFVAVDVTFAQNRSLGSDGEIGRRDIVCLASGGGGGSPGVGGAIASLPGSVTVLRSDRDVSCRFVANSARGGAGGGVGEPMSVEALNEHPDCGGRGAGSEGGRGGRIAAAGSSAINGEPGGLFSGGGGGSTAEFGSQAGDGGDGGFGAGGGAAALTVIGEYGVPGRGGFGGGSSAAEPAFDPARAGAGGGGGAGLGGAIAVLDADIVIENCRFEENRAEGGSGGRPEPDFGEGYGEDGHGYGNDVFTLTPNEDLEALGIEFQSCENIAGGLTAECAL